MTLTEIGITVLIVVALVGAGYIVGVFEERANLAKNQARRALKFPGE